MKLKFLKRFRMFLNEAWFRASGHFPRRTLHEKPRNRRQALEKAFGIGNSARVEMSWVQGSSCEDIGLQKWRKCVFNTICIFHEIWLLIVLKKWWAIRCFRSTCRLLSSEVPSVYYQIMINNSLCKAIIGIILLQSAEFETYPLSHDYLVSVKLSSKSM